VADPLDVLEGRARWCVVQGDALGVLAAMPDGCVDAIVTDPPYPEIDRAYGRMTESDWHAMMRGVVGECRRILKPNGSAVFILQPNSERVGRMRPWLWEFMAWSAREWNQIQDAWWWNHAALPTVHCRREHGLMRPSLKAAVWLGASDCYRNQSAVLVPPSQHTIADTTPLEHLKTSPSGAHIRSGRACATSIERGGSTPFNVTPFANVNSSTSSGAHGHGAGTPIELAAWWTRYIVPAGGIACDPFSGAGTMGIAAMDHGARFVGSEREAEYVEIARARIAHAARQELLPGVVVARPAPAAEPDRQASLFEEASRG